MFTLTRPTVTVQAPVQIDRQLYDDARAFHELGIFGRLVLRYVSPRRYERGLYALRQVPVELLDAPRVVAGPDTARMGYFERKVRESRGY